MTAHDAHLKKKHIRERGWQLVVNDAGVSVFRPRKPWATWVPIVLLIFVAGNSYREIVTTDNVHNTVLASIIWGVLFLAPAAWVFWLWGYDRKRTIARFMNRKDLPEGTSITLRDNHGGRHDFVVPTDEADRIQDRLPA